MFAFVDESGFPRPTDDSEYSVLLAACMKTEVIRSLASRVYQLKEYSFGGGNEVEIKAKNFITPNTLSPRRSINKDFADRLFEIIDGENISVYAIVMEKPEYEPLVQPNMLPIHYTYLLQRVNAFADMNNRSIALIFDGQDPSRDEMISQKFNNLVFRDPRFHQIIEMPLFVSSKIVPGIQIADIMAGVTRHYYNRHLNNQSPKDAFEEWIKSMYTIIDKKVTSLKKVGYSFPGIYLLNKNNFQRSV